MTHPDFSPWQQQLKSSKLKPAAIYREFLWISPHYVSWNESYAEVSFTREALISEYVEKLGESKETHSSYIFGSSAQQGNAYSYYNLAPSVFFLPHSLQIKLGPQGETERRLHGWFLTGSYSQAILKITLFEFFKKWGKTNSIFIMR